MHCVAMQGGQVHHLNADDATLARLRANADFRLFGATNRWSDFHHIVAQIKQRLPRLWNGSKAPTYCLNFRVGPTPFSKNLQKPLVRPKGMRKFTRLFMFEPIKAELDGAAEKLGRLRRFL